MKWYVIICRLEGMYEDLLYLERAINAETALALAREELRSDRNDTENEFYLNYIVQCDTEPTVLLEAANMLYQLTVYRKPTHGRI